MARILPRVLLIGAGEIGSAVCHRLVMSGFRVYLIDREEPWCVRRAVCFAMACYRGTKVVEGLTAERVGSVDEADRLTSRGRIPLMTGDLIAVAAGMRPEVLVDARMLKRESEISLDLAELVIGLGPGFVAGDNVHAVVETMRGNDLGRVISQGRALAHTGIPAEVMGYGAERVIRAPKDGIFKATASLGDVVSKDEVLGTIDGVDVVAAIPGLVRGLIMNDLEVRHGQKIGDIDPRGAAVDINRISDKGRAVAGGVLEAIMNWWTQDADE
jgi:xanthine dehydrogenase accessory factor